MAIRCVACKSPRVSAARAPKFPGLVRAAGVVVMSPGLLCVGFAGWLGLDELRDWEASGWSIRHPQSASLGFTVFLMLFLSSFGLPFLLLGWRLAGFRKVYRCGDCGYLLDRRGSEPRRSARRSSTSRTRRRYVLAPLAVVAAGCIGVYWNRHALLLEPLDRWMFKAEEELYPSPDGTLIARVELWNFGAAGYTNLAFLSTASGWYEFLVFSTHNFSIEWIDSRHLRVKAIHTARCGNDDFDVRQCYRVGGRDVLVSIDRPPTCCNRSTAWLEWMSSESKPSAARPR